MEEWDFIDERDIRGKGDVVFMTCANLRYGVDRYCRTMLGFNLRQKQLLHAEHLKKRFKPWAATWQKDMAGLLGLAR